MRLALEPVALDGAHLIRFSPVHDERGFFARSWCVDTFKNAGIDFDVVQANFSTTKQRGTIRGMHFQRQPRADAKVVRCTRGRIYEVIADLRIGSPTFGRWHATELSENSCTMMYVPRGFAQGFQALSDNVMVEYLMGERYEPSLYCGFRYDDISIGIEWPLPVSLISDQDLAWAPLATFPPRAGPESRSAPPKGLGEQRSAAGTKAARHHKNGDHGPTFFENRPAE